MSGPMSDDMHYKTGVILQNENRGITEPFPTPMEKIDGTKVRQLRESQNLTQLYLATAVGVTTDTISRWENKRYPAIKRDNAEKLAEALGVALPEILEVSVTQTSSSEPAAVIPAPPPDSSSLLSPPVSKNRLSQISKKNWLAATAGIVFCLAFLVIWYLNSNKAIPQITAHRLLPIQTFANQLFPVVIIVETDEKKVDPSSFMLKEIPPAAAQASQIIPQPASLDRETNAIKWISRTTAPKMTFGYMAKVKTNGDFSQPHRFEGSITIKTSNRATPITGNNSILLNHHHWADTNQDNRIDDDEILAVYDTYDGIKGLEVGIEKIDAIWSGHGYSWDETKGEIEVIP